MNTTTTTTVSAPGKILLAGGYVVLEAPNEGVVLAVDKRFYSTVEMDSTTNPTVNGNDEPAENRAKCDPSVSITVNSPQFGAKWKYQATASNGSLALAADPTNATSNSFVEKTLRVTLAYLLLGNATKSPPPQLTDLNITILADNDFYSVAPHLKARNWDATVENLERLPSFLPCNTGNGSLQKTGLGSSAALVTSLVGALVLSFTSTSNNNKTDENGTSIRQPIVDETTQRRIHNLAQICHCHAQGKVGSGFDVSSACYGSHVYRRFPKSLLSGLLQDLEPNTEQQPDIIGPATIDTLQNLVPEASEKYIWTGGCLKALPWSTKLLQVMLADVSGGSESPSMARKILSWKASSDDISCWDNLVRGNTRVVELLEEIMAALANNGKDIDDMAEKFSSSHFDTDTVSKEFSGEAGVVGSLLCELRKVLGQNRANMKQMGQLADVPAEPDEQTALADATMEIPGVVSALVPGAGGFDALVVVYVNTTKVRAAICDLWRTYKPLQVCPLAVQYAEYGAGVQYESVTPKYETQ